VFSRSLHERRQKLKGATLMLFPPRHSRTGFVTRNWTIWIGLSIALLFIAGLPVDQAKSGISPSVVLSPSAWTPIGPAPVNGPFAGRIDVAAPNPSNSNVMYLGANNGGIWKTTNWLDSSPTWTEITDKPQILSLAIHEHDLVVFPGNPDIVIAGASGPGGGILRSDNAGNTWSYLGNSRFDMAEFGAIVVDPNVANAQTLYAAISGGFANFASGSGLYKSTDGGTTWSDAGSGVFSGFVSDVLTIQENGQTVLYAADTGNGLPNSGGIYRSANGGGSWTPTNLPANVTGYGSIRLAGSTAPTEQIYASIIDNAKPDGGLVSRLVTSNKGTSWSALTWPDALGPGLRHRSHHNLLAVDPANSNIVYVNTDIENNLISIPCGGKTQPCAEWIWKSSDSGQTWQQAVNGGGDPVSAGFDATGVFISTGDAGIFRDPVNANDNRGNNLNTIEFYGFSLDPSNPRRAYGLFQDGPGVLRYVGTVDWQYSQPSGGQGEAGKIRVDPTNSNRVYYLDPNTSESVNAPTASNRFVHSDDGGQTWTAAITGLPTIQSGGNTIVDFASFPGKGSIVIDPNSPQRLLLGLHSVFETTTGGDPNTTDPKFGGNGWRDIGQNMGNNGSAISAIALAPFDPSTIFAGTEDGHVFKTTNAGNDCSPNCPTWTQVDSGLPLQDQRVMDLEVSPNNPDYDFAVTSPFLGRDDKAPDFSGFFHVWKRNGGAWSPINGNLPTKLGGESLAVDWQQPTPVLYIGTLRGAYASNDLGTTWTRMDTLPRTRVTDLDFMPGTYLLGAGTMGWGAWEILTQATPPTVNPPADQTSVEGASHVFGLGSFSDPDGGPWSVDINWGDGTSDTAFTANSPGPLASKTHKYGEEGPHTVTITVTDTLIDQSDSKTFTVNVSDPPVAASGGFSFDANVFVDTGTQTLATFTDPAGAEPNASDPAPPTSAGHYAASVSWGDGTSPGAIAPLTPASPTQVFTVTGSHTYTTESPVSGFNVVATIDHEGVKSTATSIAIVGRPGNVTGGGKIGNGLDFDFGVQPDENNGFKGHLNYKDKANDLDLRSTSITFVSILIDNKHATIKGTATVNGISGYTFTVHVEDNGEPGIGSDRLRIELSGPTSYDSDAFAANGGLLTSGNIQAHK
jgi:PKD domain